MSYLLSLKTLVTSFDSVNAKMKVIV